MFYFNKIVLLLVNPVVVGLALFFAALYALYANRIIAAKRYFIMVAIWFYFWGTGFCQNVMCWMFSLDRYPIVAIERLPDADAIVDLGGGMGVNEKISKYAEINGPSDRAWHAARLWKAGKAPIVVVSGVGIGKTDATLIRDLGVDVKSLIKEENARNTEENAIYVQDQLLQKVNRADDKPIKVLLVTSISHMRRAMMIFRKYAPKLECVAASCDYGEVSYLGRLTAKCFLPSLGAMNKNMVVYKECLGIVGYWLRGARD